MWIRRVTRRARDVRKSVQANFFSDLQANKVVTPSGCPNFVSKPSSPVHCGTIFFPLQYQVVPPGHPDIVPPPSAKGHANRMIECPHALVGYLIGKKGAMIKRIKVGSRLVCLTKCTVLALCGFR